MHRGRSKFSPYVLVGLFIFFFVLTAMKAKAADLPKELQGVRRIVTLGDSITQGGGEPDGYVWLLDKHLKTLYPNHPIEIINAGISGHKSTDMQARFQRDVLDKKPDLVTISVGINDVWHGFYDFDKKVRHPRGDLAAGIPLPLYREKVEAMIKAAQGAGVRVALLTPTIIYEDLQSDENVRVRQYIQTLRSLAKQHNCVFIDLNTPFHNIISSYQKYASGPANVLTTDGVHMNKAGYQLMTSLILRGLGVPDKDLASLRTRALK